MSTHEGIKTVSMIAGVAIAAGSLYELVAINSAGKVVKCDFDGTAVGEREPAGILAQDSAKLNDVVTIIDLDAGGIAKVKVNAAVAAGATLVPSVTAGKADDVAAVGVLAADQVPFGKALEAATAANQIVSFKIGRFAAPHVA